ncbi:MAG: lactate racemase domain-containing protein [Clostridia bacterium]
MPILPESAKNIVLPKMVPVKQIFPDDRIADVPAVIAAQFAREEIRASVEAGKTAAVLCGSRGISQIDLVTKCVIDNLKALGVEPFIVPAMGSHGGATAEGQIAVLAGYGITEETMGVPIKASMETIIVGEIEPGFPVHADKYAAQADYIIPINRVKVHTAFDGEIESGVCKMLSIGIGKHNGCSRIHQVGFPNFPIYIPKVSDVILNTFCIPFGVALVENAHEHLHTIRLLPRETLVEEEKELLKLSKSLMPKLNFEAVDILIVEQIGKDISGDGMDPNITGRLAGQPTSPYYTGPKIKRIIVNRLSEGTHGNFVGIGCADFTTRALMQDLDYMSTYANLIACCVPENAKIPMILENEEEALKAAAITCHGVDENEITVVKILDTLHLVDIQVSENLLPYCRSNPIFEVKA